MARYKNLDLDDQGFYDFLEQIIDSGQLEDAAMGIATLVAHKGVDVLTKKQLFVFEKYVIEPNVVESCARCGSGIPWSEMHQATETEFCSWCEHMYGKMMAE